VLVSSHQLAELALGADHAVIIRDGRLVAQGTVDDLAGGDERVHLRTPHTGQLVAALQRAGIPVSRSVDDEVVAEASTEAVGRAVATSGIAVYEMRAHRRSLEDAYLTMTRDRTTS
jgi:ABC-2 type transport system ATP-binding protein